ncbi:MAG TPA: LLM class flavin-dependent oxidoreductase [Candidatus Limnocylindrales bacterium]|jgi:alkanesulfonate monooxygenase SsuD/methylene tetrahydromethanopterin reductase-like flavin-dependent oxidoreductase (luciferase family)
MTNSLPADRLGLGAYVTTWGPPGKPLPRWAEMRAIGIGLEQTGVDTLWVADEPGFWEPWSVLPALAATTSRVELGPLVLSTGYRAPAMVASMAESFDEVSGGRLILGLGAGVGPTDHRWAELGYDSAKHIGRFVEAVEITARLLREDEPLTFDGQFFHLAGAKPKPQGPRPGGPPLWVAASRPRTLGVAARWADAVNWSENLTSAESVREALAAVAQACELVGRDPTTLPLTACVRLELDATAAETRADSLAGDDVAVIATLQEMHAAGLRHVTFFTGDPDDKGPFPSMTPRAIDKLAPIVEALKA